MHLVESIVGEKLDKASADQVLEHTGYVIGGIPPVGHTKQIRTLIDVDLAQYSEIWAAAGTPRAVFKLTPELLQRICGGQIVRIA